MIKKVYSLWFMVYGILFVIIAMDCGLWTVDCFAQQLVSSTDLIERAKELDGQEVVYAGEVIGEVMSRGGHSWVNLNDGSNAIGIWMGNNFLNLISFAGSYRAKGDWLEVKGKFNRACRQHGGDLDIHAERVLKLNSGKLVRQQLVPAKKKIVMLLSGVFLCLLILPLLNKRRLRK